MHCPMKLILNNGSVNYSSNAIANSSVNFTCNKCYKLEGPDTKTCAVHQSNKFVQWTPSTAPYCRRKRRRGISGCRVSISRHSVSVQYCRRPIAPANGYIAYVSDHQIHYSRCGARLRYDCARGYRYTGAAEYTCSEDGKWYPQISPKCSRMSCYPVYSQAFITSRYSDLLSEPSLSNISSEIKCFFNKSEFCGYLLVQWL